MPPLPFGNEAVQELMDRADEEERTNAARFEPWMPAEIQWLDQVQDAEPGALCTGKCCLHRQASTGTNVTDRCRSVALVRDGPQGKAKCLECFRAARGGRTCQCLCRREDGLPLFLSKAEEKLERKRAAAAEPAAPGAPPRKKSKGVCTFWTKGTCERGQACRFAHPTGEGSLRGSVRGGSPPKRGEAPMPEAKSYAGHREPAPGAGAGAPNTTPYSPAVGLSAVPRAVDQPAAGPRDIPTTVKTVAGPYPLGGFCEVPESLLRWGTPDGTEGVRPEKDIQFHVAAEEWQTDPAIELRHVWILEEKSKWSGCTTPDLGHAVNTIWSWSGGCACDLYTMHELETFPDRLWPMCSCQGSKLREVTVDHLLSATHLDNKLWHARHSSPRRQCQLELPARAYGRAPKAWQQQALSLARSSAICFESMMPKQFSADDVQPFSNGLRATTANQRAEMGRDFYDMLTNAVLRWDT